MTDAVPTRHALVTGGAGFIGSHLVEALLARGDRVTVIDDFSTGRRSNLDAASAKWGSRLRVIEGRVGAVLESSLPRPDLVFHLAAAVGVRLVVERPIHTIENNVLETSALLRFAASHESPTLVASTSEVYGKGVRTPFREDDDVLYGPTSVTRWSYACSKAIDEYLALAYHREHGLPVVVVRLFNTVGPRQVGDYGMVLPSFVERALRGEPLEVHGDGQQTRCFCDVRDVVPGLVALVGNEACRGRIFNLGRDEPISIESLAQRVVRALGSRSPVRLVPYKDVFPVQFDDLRVRQPDLARVREAIGFSPSIDLERTIRDLAAEIERRLAGSRSAAS
ncbi:MAG: NAD-dependent epimerase/dehydratase family protein [Phycisphaerae bacterium]|nr:NAD-dependent epimerase/dehydratase family protein [Phycisphaerae bacterium]